MGETKQQKVVNQLLSTGAQLISYNQGMAILTKPGSEEERYYVNGKGELYAGTKPPGNMPGNPKAYCNRLT